MSVDPISLFGLTPTQLLIVGLIIAMVVATTTVVSRINKMTLTISSDLRDVHSRVTKLRDDFNQHDGGCREWRGECRVRIETVEKQLDAYQDGRVDELTRIVRNLADQKSG